MKDPEKLIALNGGKPVAATKLDGTTETVLVPQVSVRSFMTLIEHLGNEPLLICMACGKPVEWVDTLAPESYEQIVTLFEEINGDFFKRWAQRMLKRQEAIAPGLVQKFMGTVGTSPTLSQTPA